MNRGQKCPLFFSVDLIFKYYILKSAAGSPKNSFKGDLRALISFMILYT